MNKKDKISLLAISFSKGFISPQVPIATFYQNGKELNFIIDTGSDDNVIAREALDGLKYEKVEMPGKTLSGVGGVFNVEVCNIEFESEDDKFTDTFIIADHLKDAFDNIRRCHAIPLHGMIGSKFLNEHRLVLDFTNYIAYTKPDKE